MQLMNILDQVPPKHLPFLAYTICGWNMMEWKERIIDGESRGWYGFYNPCACCTGFCTTDFKYWTLLPEVPEGK